MPLDENYRPDSTKSGLSPREEQLFAQEIEGRLSPQGANPDNGTTNADSTNGSFTGQEPIPHQPKKRNCGCLAFFLIFFTLCLICSLIVNCVLLADQISSGSLGTNIDEGKASFKYKLIDVPEGEKDTHKIVFLPVYGTISTEGGDKYSTPTCTPDGLREALSFLNKDDEVIAVVLDVNSPGGGLTASDMMLHQLKVFKERSKFPIYAYFEDTACSGGYYISMAADDIYACPTTMTGSIGVIMQMPEASELLKKVGVNFNTITSLNEKGETSFKDIGSAFRKMRPEERKLLQNLITESWNQFVDVVAEGRGEQRLPKAKVKSLADGRVFSAQQALNLHLIDGVCYPDELCTKIRNKCSSPKAIGVRLTHDKSFLDSFGSLGVSTYPLEALRSLTVPAPAQMERRYQAETGIIR